jgi:hypothetical protein
VSRDAQHIGDLMAQQALTRDGFAGWLRIQRLNRPKTAGNFIVIVTFLFALVAIPWAIASDSWSPIFFCGFLWFTFLFVPGRDLRRR